MGKVLLGILWTSVVGPLLFLSLMVFDPSLQRALYFPLGAITALILGIAFIVAKRDQLLNLSQFLVVTVTAGLTSLLIFAGVVHVLFQTIPHIVWVLFPYGFTLVDYVVQSFLPTVLYSIFCGSVFWYVAIHRNASFVCPYPRFVAKNMSALRKARPVIEVPPVPTRETDDSRQEAA